MRIFPAIDIIDGKCVMLEQGKFDRVSKFSDRPYEMAKKWESEGASYLHIIDLDGAKKGSGYNNNTIREIIKNINIPIQVGGGIRTLSDIKEKFELGVDRVILGTVAVNDTEFVKQAVGLYKDKIVVGIDAKDGFAATQAWLDVSGTKAIDLAKKMESLGVKTINFTDISKDGMMKGPNIESTREMVENTNINIIASGGVSSMDDLENLSKLNVYGAIVGTALYEKAMDLKTIIEKYEKR